MKMSRTRFVVAALVATLLCSRGVRADQKAKEEADEAARAWLDLVDNEDYAASWERAAELFKSAVKREQWEQQITTVRKPLGGLVSRKLKSRDYATSLPGAPDGEYVVIQYEAAFENKKSAIETVTPMKEKDGSWRVSGYYIR